MTTLIGISVEDLKELLVEASKEGAAIALSNSANQQDEILSLEDSMELTGYKTRGYFRSWAKENGITAADVRKRKPYYSKNELLAAKRKKGLRK